MPKFQSFWFGEALSPYQRLAMKSFVDRGHEYDLYAYKMFDVPAGVELRDANDILPESRVFFYGERAGVGRGSVAGFSNLFRYHLLHRRGNWWVDADVICLSDAIPSTEIFMGWEYEHLIGNAILKFPEKHWLMDDLRNLSDRAGPDLEWGTTGPNLVTQLVRKNNLLDLVSPQSLAYPVQSMDALHLLIPARCAEMHERIKGKPFLHMWNEVLRRAVILPWMAPPSGSLIAELFDRHGVDFGGSPNYTADQVQRLSDNYFASATWSHQFAERAETTRYEARLRAAEMRTNSLANEVSQLRAQVHALQSSKYWGLPALFRQAATFLRIR
jgi:hypothetical protein